jgi:hypothetical protein
MFREVSAYSDFQARARGAESSNARLQKVSGSKMATCQIAQLLRKSFDLPAPCRDCSRQVSSLGFSLQPRPVSPITPLYLFTRTTCPLEPCRLHACRPLVPSLLLSPARRASLERFGRSSPLPVLLQVSVRQSPGKHRLRAHRRRSARPPRV